MPCFTCSTHLVQQTTLSRFHHIISPTPPNLSPPLFNRLFPWLVQISDKMSQLYLIRSPNMTQFQTRYTQWSASMHVFRSLRKHSTNSSALLWPSYRRAKLSSFRKSSKKITVWPGDHKPPVCPSLTQHQPLHLFRIFMKFGTGLCKRREIKRQFHENWLCDSRTYLKS